MKELAPARVLAATTTILKQAFIVMRVKRRK